MRQVSITQIPRLCIQYKYRSYKMCNWYNPTRSNEWTTPNRVKRVTKQIHAQLGSIAKASKCSSSPPHTARTSGCNSP